MHDHGHEQGDAPPESFERAARREVKVVARLPWAGVHTEWYGACDGFVSPLSRVNLQDFPLDPRS